MKNFKQYFVTITGIFFLTIYYVCSFLEINYGYLFYITIFIFAFIGMLIERYLFIMKEKIKENL